MFDSDEAQRRKRFFEAGKRLGEIMIYNPICTVERIAAEISETYPEKSVALLTAATAIESELSLARGDSDRMALSEHWES